ncbi:MAG: hypothetical protein QM608_21295 [Caulobacter sp.]
MASKHLSLPAPITLRFAERQRVRHPIIVVPSGVRSPAVVRKPILKTPENGVYVRTLRTNGSVSTALAQAGDWPDLIQRCFDNREADVASFIRRHLADVSPGLIKSLMAIKTVAAPDLKALTAALMDRNKKRFATALVEQGPTPFQAAWGGAETALQIWPPREDQVADKSFWRTLQVADPRYGGLALWWDAGGLGPPATPVIKQGAWESWVVIDKGWQVFDFMRADPTGAFYQRRMYPIDAFAQRNGGTPGVGFDPGLAVQDVAEAMAAGLQFATALGWAAEEAVLGFQFRWTGLQGRVLTSLSGGMQPPFDRAADDEAVSFVEIPLATAPLAVAPYARKATQSLIALFGGEVLTADFVERVVRARLEHGR